MVSPYSQTPHDAMLLGSTPLTYTYLLFILIIHHFVDSIYIHNRTALQVSHATYAFLFPSQAMYLSSLLQNPKLKFIVVPVLPSHNS